MLKRLAAKFSSGQHLPPVDTTSSWNRPLAWSVVLLLGSMHFQATAQTGGAADTTLSLSVEQLDIRIINPSADAAVNDRIVDEVRRKLDIYPGDRYSEDRFNFAVSQASRVRDVAGVHYEQLPGSQGGMRVQLHIKLSESTLGAHGQSSTKDGSGNTFPLLYDKDGTTLRAKLELFSLYYANNNAWYGRPDLMLAGNPLVSGKPSGRGYDQWLEGYVHYGLYGITPLSPTAYLYGGLSAITSGSIGQELFTNDTRSHTGIEDAYAGVVFGETSEQGNRLSVNLSAGRQRFTLANGFLFANTAASGHDRAALQANARWAADNLVLARVRYNRNVFEAFYLDPDELPKVDSKTAYAGLNIETTPTPGLTLGGAFITAPRSEFKYFGPTGSPLGTRDGLKVYDLRANFTPGTPGMAGPFFGAEYAVQRHSRFPMAANAGWVEAGYSWPQAKWSPTISYRLAKFSGDKADTSKYERWDPLLSGGTGEQWVQGSNHFKVVQDSNVIAHRFQARFKPSARVELVPQLWFFYADSTNNIGGNPALSNLSGQKYGTEVVLTAKWFYSRNIYVHGHLAYTWAGGPARKALGGDAHNWLSTMLFVRYAF